MEAIFGVVLLLAFALAITYLMRLRSARRRRFIEGFVMPEPVLRRFRELRPELTSEQERRVRAGLTQWFAVCLEARGRFVSMPSQVVDDLWHTFILFTRSYEQFCRTAFGRYLHHTPVEAMSSPTIATQGIRRTWRICCGFEKIDPTAPKRLPLLFALDGELRIPNGFVYATHCQPGSGTYCASDIGCGGGGNCGSNCGGSWGSSHSSDGAGTSCGSSCGGGGCGGGGH